MSKSLACRVLGIASLVLLGSALSGGCTVSTSSETCNVRCENVRSTCIKKCINDSCKTKCSTDFDDCATSCTPAKSSDAGAKPSDASVIHY